MNNFKVFFKKLFFLLISLLLVYLLCDYVYKNYYDTPIFGINKLETNPNAHNSAKRYILITKDNFDKWYDDSLGRSPFSSYELNNVIFQGKFSRTNGILPAFELTYLYHSSPLSKECKHSLSFILHDLYESFDDEQLEKMIDKQLTFYAPKIRYIPFKREEFSKCGLHATIEVYSGWKIVNIKDFNLINPQRNPTFLK